MAAHSSRIGASVRTRYILTYPNVYLVKDICRPVRVAVLTEIISPYRIPVFNELAKDPRIDLEVLFFSESEERRRWRVPWEKIRFKSSILPGMLVAHRYQDGPMFLNPTIIAALWRGKYQTIICFGYHHPTIWMALLWSRWSRKRSLLWSESTRRDIRSSSGVVEILKRQMIQCFTGFVAAGTAQVEYLRDLGAAQKDIWIAPDAVDSDFFISQCQVHRKQKTAIKESLGVKGPIVLYVGRLLDAKGIPDLIEAFEHVVKHQHATLMLVGDGPDMERYKAMCRERGLTSVHFAGFRPQEELPQYYGIADVFVFPTRSDPWGLVLNEAMCAGLPVICSTAAGAAVDLVRAGHNGLLQEPGDIEAIVRHLSILLSDDKLRLLMGANSREIIAAFSPERMAQGLSEAVLNMQHQGYANTQNE